MSAQNGEMGQLLRRVGELLKDPARRTTDTFAREANGDECHWDNGNAVCWCLSGAIKRIGGDPLNDELYEAVQRLLEIPLDVAICGAWDDETDEWRQSAVEKLLKAGEQ